MKKSLTGLLATAAVLAVSAVPATAATLNVTVRVEGATATLLATTPVTLDSSVTDAASGCAGDTPAAAIQKATNGNWDKQLFTSTILGESHTFADSDYWSEWVSNHYGGGICSDHLQNGDAVLMLVDRTPAPDYASTAFPLVVTAPATVAPGTAFTATVTKYTADAAFNPGSSVAAPADGVTVTAGGQTATTDASGKATLTLTERGPVQLRASMTTTRSDNAATCVTDGADGFCGTTKAGETVPPITTNPDPPHLAPPVIVPDKTPGTSKVSIKDKQTFKKGKGPRTLTGTADGTGSGVRWVKARIVRKQGKACTTFSGKYERFVKAPCGIEHGRFFKVGTTSSWSYLLPAKLAAGTYTIETRVTDASGNVEKARTGANRITFTVK